MFDLKGGKIVIDPNILAIPQFARVWDRDESEDKEIAMKELGYLFYMYNFKSPYRQHYADEDERNIVVVADTMPDNWKIDSILNTASAKYRKFVETKSMDLLEAAEVGLKTLGTRLRDPNIATKDLLTSMKQLKDTLTNYDSLKQAVEKELLNSESRTKGTVTIRDRERVKS